MWKGCIYYGYPGQKCPSSYGARCEKYDKFFDGSFSCHGDCFVSKKMNKKLKWVVEYVK